MKHLRTFIAIALASIAALSNATACSPARLTPQEIYDNADTIIVARAISSNWTREPKKNFLGVLGYLIKNLGPYLMRDDTTRHGKTVFKIERTLKGEPKKYITVRHYVDPATCGVTFNAYENYLVFVRTYRKKNFVSVFSVRPFLSEDDYLELTELVGLREDDYVRPYRNFLEAIDAR